MKRTTREQQTDPGKQPVIVDRARLNTVRGSLGIAIRVAGPVAPDMQNQHNELLVAV